MLKRIFFYIFIFFSIIIFSSEIDNLQVLEDWDDYEISVDGNNLDCPKCIPYKLKVSNNDSICISIPRIYNISSIAENENDIKVTFLSLRTELDDDHYWVAWPFERYVLASKDFKNFPLKIYSVMGFEIDETQNYYLLDQGIIIKDNNTVIQNTSKLVIFTKSGAEVNVTYFNETDFTTSLLTDIVVDRGKQYAYITDSGNLLNNNSIPRLIVVDLKNNKYYKILNNNTGLKPDDDNITLKYSGNEIYDYFTNITGLNSIQISCDGEKIFFSSLKSNKLYSVATKDITEAIKSYEDSGNIKYLNEIKIEYTEKGIIANSFFMTSKKNILMANGDNGSIRFLFSLDDKDFQNYNFDDFSEIKAEKFIINWPQSIDINNGKLFLLDNGYFNRTHKRNDTNDTDTNDTLLMREFWEDGEHDNETTPNETVGRFVVYTANLSYDELSYKKGCTIYIFKINYYMIFLWSLLGIIFFVVIFVMIIGSDRNISKKKKVNNEENVAELNRALNENNNNNKNDDDE